MDKLVRLLRGFLFLGLTIFSIACDNDHSVAVPEWTGGGILAQTTPLPPGTRPGLEGIYAVEQGADQFGGQVVIRWNGDYVGIYTGFNVGYFVMQAGSIDSTVYVQGYWRYQNSDETGLALFEISEERGGRFLLGDTTGGMPVLRLTGSFGNGQENPGSPVVFVYSRPIPQELLDREYYVVSHHGSGGTPTALPASENTVEIARIIERYGANGIEIDIRPTSDGIPILFHDNSLSWRLTQRGPLVGPAENYTYEQLRSFVVLLHGEKIPSLEDFLDVVIMETTLRFVYIDCKPTIAPHLATVASIQEAALAKAASVGRDVQIYLAITTDEMLSGFLSLPDFANIPSICELGTDKLAQANSHVWSPRFTEGLQLAEIEALHAQGRIAITWTVNTPLLIKQYLEQGLFDGMLSDFPTLVSYYFYTQ